MFLTFIFSRIVEKAIKFGSVEKSVGESWILCSKFYLNQLSYILIVFVLSCTFWKKVRKTSAHGKGFSLRQHEQRMVKRSTGVARTVWVAKSECCQKQYYSNIGFLTWLKLLPLALCVNKFPHINIVDFFITRSIISNKFVLSSLNQEIRLLAIFNGAV